MYVYLTYSYNDRMDITDLAGMFPYVATYARQLMSNERWNKPGNITLLVTATFSDLLNESLKRAIKHIKHRTI